MNELIDKLHEILLSHIPISTNIITINRYDLSLRASIELSKTGFHYLDELLEAHIHLIQSIFKWDDITKTLIRDDQLIHYILMSLLETVDNVLARPTIHINRVSNRDTMKLFDLLDIDYDQLRANPTEYIFNTSQSSHINHQLVCIAHQRMKNDIS